MKYNTITIIPYSNKYDVSINRSEEDRVETETIPSSLGFFHYPETMSDQEAFNILKEHMMEVARERMVMASNDLVALLKLKLNE